ncbi:helix-turn-helix transcriptional regulator [Micromonospora cathayae]|uniref:AAA family ATPase n=1 Tax=Micromonospora cathayae TaxID=3028804 RepID=A0ABY7ZM98_9ACTN|nr:LuxR family transcriptional regulator [Micromonospora sp. HUAS 3]WDZ83213.1 AAA family ATPase [Micromonospora sp. HUAS 3]
MGRRDELRTLADALSAARAGHGRAVFLVGPAGIGKSRLVAAAGALATVAGMPVLSGRSSVIGPAIPLRPLREALVTAPATLDGCPLTELGPYRPALARLVPEWFPPGGSDQPPGPVGHDLLAVAEGMLRLGGLTGRDRGCLLLLDDLHDADDETLAVLDYLVDHLHRQPATLVGALRPDPGPALDLVRAAARRGACRTVELRPLGPDAVRRLAAGHLDSHPDALPSPAVDLLWAVSGGNPALAGDALAELRATGVLHDTGTGWRMDSPSAGPLPTLTRPLDQLTPPQRDLLLLGALLGPMFSGTVLRRATGRPDPEIRDDLAGAAVARLVRPDRSHPDRYTFVHPLLRVAIRATLPPPERRRLARWAAEAVTDVHPGPSVPHPRTVAALWVDAGEPTVAGHLLTAAGRHALGRGAAGEAADLLHHGTGLLADADAAVRAAGLTDLLDALTEAGDPDRAFGHAAALDDLADHLDPAPRVHLHTALARAADAAGRTADARRHVDLARTLLDPAARAADPAVVDVLAAQLDAGDARPERAGVAEATARRAAMSGPPAVLWQAGLLLGELTRARDPDEATAHLTRAWSVAVRQHVPRWELHALVRLGDDDALRGGDLDRLDQAHRTAARVGAVSARQEAEVRLARHAVLRGDFATVDRLTERLLATAPPPLRRRALLVRATADAHRDRPRDLADALLRYRRDGGDPVRYASWIHGLARVFAALLREDRARALHESYRAARADLDHPASCPLAGRHGAHLLLRAVTGDLTPAGHADLAPGTGVGGLRWNHQFRLFARAVLAGRAGATAEARAAVDEALRVAQPYPVARHLGLRLVSEAAMADGWGDPVGWLRVAEEHFHRAEVPAVAAACRRLLRRAGSRPVQRRAGTEDVPAALRSHGVTPREYEVLGLLAERLSNREIADRLHLSARTVEKHVASLLAKTGQPDRIAVGRLAPLRSGEPGWFVDDQIG